MHIRALWLLVLTSLLVFLGQQPYAQALSRGSANRFVGNNSVPLVIPFYGTTTGC